jgi:carbonic anhydrase
MTTIDIIYRCETQGSPAQPRPADSAAALLRLDAGNRGFAALLDQPPGPGGRTQRIVAVDPHDLGIASGEARAPMQHPFAAVLGCADARVPVELIFNEGPNDLFVVRVAGNCLGPDVLGSLKYAVDHMSDSIKLIVVLGHSGCGALTAAVDIFLRPAAYLPLATNHALRTILDALLVVVQASAKKFHDVFGADVARRPCYRQALIEASIVTNAALAAYSIQQEFDPGQTTGLQTVYGVYLLDARRVWAPPAAGPGGSGLAPAPRDRAGFAELGNLILRSVRISALITQGT